MLNEKETHSYDDIINLPHHRSSVRPHMTMQDRAAQFSPFAALTGHDEAVRETARLTCRKAELSEEEKALLNRRLAVIRDNLGSGELYSFSYFEPDAKKEGGAYKIREASVKKIDEFGGRLILSDGYELEIADITAVEGDIFNRYSPEFM